MRLPTIREARLRSAGRPLRFTTRNSTPGTSLKVLSYTSTLRSLRVHDSVACGWFEEAAEYKPSPESAPVSWQSKALIVRFDTALTTDTLPRGKESCTVPQRIACGSLSRPRRKADA